MVAYYEALLEEVGAEAALPQFSREIRELLMALPAVVDVGTSNEVFSAAAEPTLRKLVTVNDLTGQVTAYRAEKLTLTVHWGKTLLALGKILTGLSAATSPTFLGFVGLSIALHGFVTALGVTLTSTEACVFTAVYNNRDEFFGLPEERLLEVCQIMTAERKVTGFDEAKMAGALNALLSLGILELIDGRILLRDEWVVSGSWR
ncbi:MAG: hypothetical protein JSS72_04055 [Armatimonadetes bacterium]|nr:hypothetical protein [Armatimonadota bacterium]